VSEEATEPSHDNEFRSASSAVGGVTFARFFERLAKEISHRTGDEHLRA